MTRRFLLLVAILPLIAAEPSDKAKKIGGGLNFFSEKDEAAMGRRYSDELNGKLQIVQDANINQYVQHMGRRLTERSRRKNIEYQFRVVNTREVNAFALPGGFVYVNRGLIEAADNESEVAGVVGHEIGHVVGRHGTKQMSKQLLLAGIVVGAGYAAGRKSKTWGDIITTAGGFGVLMAAMKYSRNDERQADWLGLEEMTLANYNPRGLITFFQKLDKSKGKTGGAGKWLSILSTHPPSAERVANLEREMQALEFSPDRVNEDAAGFASLRTQLARLPLPPPNQDKTLTSALSTLDAGASKPNEPPVAPPSGGRAKTLTVPGGTVWLDTGIELAQGESFEIWTEGEIFLRKDSVDPCDPDGMPGTGKGFFKPMSRENTGALVARIGSDSNTHVLIGAHALRRAPVAGRLHLGINDDNNFDNRGSFEVVIRW